MAKELPRSAVQLPDLLLDPAGVFDLSSDQQHQQSPMALFPSSPDAEATMARAAREGGVISPQIEERMRRDREAAEDEFDKRRSDKDKGQDGQDVR